MMKNIKKNGLKSLNKKGSQSVFQTLIAVIVVAVVGIIFYTFAAQTANNELFQKKLYARELSMLTLMVESVPGSIVVNYSSPDLELEAFNYSWKNNIIKVASYQDVIPGRNVFILNKRLWNGSMVLEEPKEIYLMNNQAELIISDKQLVLDNTIVCPMQFTKPNKVLLDPIDNGIACSIADTIAGEFSLPSNLIEFEATRNVYPTGEINCLSSRGINSISADFLLTIANTTGTKATAYVAKGPKYTESATFACHILNSLDYDEIAILPIKITDEKVLDPNKAGVYLELGSPDILIAGKIAGVFNG